MTDTERLLSDALHARVDHASYEPTPMADVVGTARALRHRQRRNAGLAAAACVVVLTVPAGLLLSHDGGTGPGPSDHTSSSTPTPARTSLEDLPRGAGPRVAYAVGDTYVASDGSRLRVPVETGISAITPYHGGFLVADDRAFEGTVGLHLLDGTGAEVDGWCSAGSPVVSGDLMQTAWLSLECDSSAGVTSATIHRGISSGMGEGEATQTVDPAVDPGADPNVQLVGLSGEDVVYTSMFGDGAWVTDLQHPPRRVPGLVRASAVDATTGLVGGALSGRVGAVVDPSTGEVTMRVPGRLPVAFSPDGRYVATLGMTSATRGLSIVDVTTGEQVAELADLSGDVRQVAWEDDTHLVASVRQGPRAALVRTDVTGRLELATPALGGRDFVLAARP
ncbi:hypothetical protein ACT8ZV_20935 [Nocardioides sp. MAHUQ-72]|uniref:hypothetical protein n=1 Tax=unclassified Nocardioides TaxID=2615069 RepID=UPI003606C969